MKILASRVQRGAAGYGTIAGCKSKPMSRQPSDGVKQGKFHSIHLTKTANCKMTE